MRAGVQVQYLYPKDIPLHPTLTWFCWRHWYPDHTLFFIICLDFNLQRVLINGDVQNIWATADLTIFDVALAKSGTNVNKGCTSFTTKCTRIIGGCLHVWKKWVNEHSQDGGILGKRTITRVPLFSWLSNVMLPQCKSTAVFTIWSPNPVPGIAPTLLPRLNDWNKRFWSAMGIPMPVSLIWQMTWPSCHQPRGC